MTLKFSTFLTACAAAVLFAGPGLSSPRKDPGDSPTPPVSVSEAAKAFRDEKFDVAFDLFKKLAEQNDRAAWAALGYMYDKGLGTGKKPDEAAKWYKKAAHAGSAEAAYNLSIMFRADPARDPDKTWRTYLKKSADGGIERAAQDLYELYKSENRLLDAESTFQKALQQKMAWAMLQRALEIYDRTDKASRDEYSRLISAAAEKGDNTARYLLAADAEERGDTAQAEALYKQAADEGSLPSVMALGILKMQKDARAEGLRLLSQAAAGGYTPAKKFLAQIYENGGGMGFTPEPKKAFQLYTAVANSGDSEAYIDLGRLYETGVGVEKNKAKAAEMYKKAASFGLPEGMYNMGRIAIIGKGVAQDRKAGVQWLEKAAAAGSTNAQRDLGVLCARGDWVPKNLAKAKKLLKEASASGDTEATLALAKILMDEGDKSSNQAVALLKGAAGDGSAQAQLLLGQLFESSSTGSDDSMDQALVWYKKAAAQDYPPALCALALFYLENHEHADPAVIQNLLTRSARLGYAPAGYKLSQFIQQGVFGEPDMEKAWKACKASAQAGNSAAQCLLGTMYLEGAGGRRPDPAQAFEWYSKAAESGNTVAQCNLAKLYATGTGTAMDLKTAAEWYQRAASGGSPQGQYNLGRMLLIGLGQWKNVPEALKLLQSAADQSYAPALNQLGVLYSQGAEGLPHQPEKALEYFLPAASQGYRIAQYNLGVLCASGDLGDKNKAARRWFRKAMNQDHPEAARQLGVLYEHGLGGLVNLPLALLCYQIAQRLGSAGAADDVRRLEGSVPTADRLYKMPEDGGSFEPSEDEVQQDEPDLPNETGADSPAPSK